MLAGRLSASGTGDAAVSVVALLYEPIGRLHSLNQLIQRVRRGSGCLKS